jgi:hypothetical protein
MGALSGSRANYKRVSVARSLSLAVVGVDYPNRRGPARRFEVAICKPGERIDLIPEPKNVADSRAVAVFSERGVQLGYLTAERCGWIGGMIANGREVRAIFQHATKNGAVIRIAIDGADLMLPSISESHRYDEPDFYPDYIPPDD